MKPEKSLPIADCQLPISKSDSFQIGYWQLAIGNDFSGWSFR